MRRIARPPTLRVLAIRDAARVALLPEGTFTRTEAGRAWGLRSKQGAFQRLGELLAAGLIEKVEPGVYRRLERA